MTKYRQKDNEAVIKVTNDIEVSFPYPLPFPINIFFDIVLAIQDWSTQHGECERFRQRDHICLY